MGSFVVPFSHLVKLDVFVDVGVFVTAKIVKRVRFHGCNLFVLVYTVFVHRGRGLPSCRCRCLVS